MTFLKNITFITFAAGAVTLFTSCCSTCNTSSSVAEPAAVTASKAFPNKTTVKSKPSKANKHIVKTATGESPTEVIKPFVPHSIENHHPDAETPC